MKTRTKNEPMSSSNANIVEFHAPIPSRIINDSLKMLYVAFKNAAQKYGPLHHQQLIQPQFIDSDSSSHDEEWSSQKGWAEFVTVNSIANDSGWQQWHGPVEGLTYEWFGRFFGKPSAIDEFRFLGDSFYLALRRINSQLPKAGGFDLLLDLMHQAAASWPATLLRSQESMWNLDVVEAAVLDSDESTLAECDAIWNKTAVGPNGVAFFVHPAVETIQGNLFLAAAQFAKMIARNDLTLFVSDMHPFEPDYPIVDGDDSNEQHASAPPTLHSATTPRWDNETRSLLVGNLLIKQFLKPAKNQIDVLQAFEEEKWSKRIDDPLTPGMRDYTIPGLNRHHTNPDIIRFGKDGTGDGIRWYFVEK